MTLTQSTVSGNSTAGGMPTAAGFFRWQRDAHPEHRQRKQHHGTLTRDGGGICAYGNVTLTQSTVSGNSTAGNGARGGGIFACGDVTLTQSTVSGNSTAGTGADGGGILAVSR